MKKIPKTILIILINITIFILTFEGLVLFVFKSPRLAQNLPTRLLSSFQNLYDDAVRIIIQRDLKCTQYDGELFYTLRPGQCNFKNLEYSTTVLVNSKGLRDSEISLKSPEIIVLGDSFAMGWGVEQDQSFPAILNKTTGKKVLNAAISSFGTIREMMLLDRLDTTSLKTLIIQYCKNDIIENHIYYKNRNTLPIMSEDAFISAYEQNQNDIRYRYPGMYTFKLLEKLIEQLFKSTQQEDNFSSTEIEAKLFLNALISGARKNLNGVKIILFESDRLRAKPRDFLVKLNQIIKDSRLPKHVQEMKIVNIDELKTQDNFFIFDEHYNSHGHQKLSEIIERQLSI